MQRLRIAVGLAPSRQSARMIPMWLGLAIRNAVLFTGQHAAGSALILLTLNQPWVSRVRRSIIAALAREICEAMISE